MENSILIEVLTAVVIFTGVIVALVFGLMMAGKSLQPAGKISIDVNDGNRTLEVDPGTNLLSALAAESVFLPSACGGGGTCAMCKCHVLEGGGEILPTEKGHVNKQEEREGVRLACQLKVKQPMKIEVEPAVLDIQKFEGDRHFQQERGDLHQRTGVKAAGRSGPQLRSGWVYSD